MKTEQYQHIECLLNEVLAERERQDAKWGQQNHEPARYGLILNEEVGEVNHELCENHFHGFGSSVDHLRTELIQVAAVAVAFVERLDRWKQDNATDIPATV